MDFHIDFSVYLMREIAKSGRTFLEFFEKFSKLLVFSQLQGKKIYSDQARFLFLRVHVLKKLL